MCLNSSSWPAWTSATALLCPAAPLVPCFRCLVVEKMGNVPPCLHGLPTLWPPGQQCIGSSWPPYGPLEEKQPRRCLLLQCGCGGGALALGPAVWLGFA